MKELDKKEFPELARILKLKKEISDRETKLKGLADAVKARVLAVAGYDEKEKYRINSSLEFSTNELSSIDNEKALTALTLPLKDRLWFPQAVKFGVGDKEIAKVHGLLVVTRSAPLMKVLK